MDRTENDFFTESDAREGDPFLTRAARLPSGALERERQFLYWLCRLGGQIGPVKIQRLWEYAGSFEAVYNMKKQDLDRLSFLTAQDKQDLWEGRRNLSLLAEEYHSLRDQGIEFITPMDERYPGRLRNLHDMPVGLFIRGRVPADDAPSAAIVGARSCSFYGRDAAEYLGRELAACGIQIVSGLAYGVDAAGHKGAVSAAGAAFGVLGSGIDVCYPAANRGLYAAVLEHGGLLSEYGPGDQPQSRHFPVRNRLISGLSDVIIVVEARKKSGSLITVGLALEQGKEVFAIPGRITDPLSAGCNSLIKDGAQMLLSPEDVLDFFDLDRKKIAKVEKNSVNGLAKNEKMVYSCLDSQPKHVEEIMVKSGLASGDCMAALLVLELGGYAVQSEHQYYRKKWE